MLYHHVVWIQPKVYETLETGEVGKEVQNSPPIPIFIKSQDNVKLKDIVDELFKKWEKDLEDKFNEKSIGTTV